MNPLASIAEESDFRLVTEYMDLVDDGLDYR